MHGNKKALPQWFAETANWFVVYVRTREEHRVAKRLQGKLDAENYKVFVPTRDYAYTKNKETKIVKKPLFSGYIFIAATVEAQECLQTFEPLFYIDSDIYRLLSNDRQSFNAPLSSKDRELLMKLLDAEFNAPALKATIEGDWIEISSDSLIALNADVVRLNKRRQTATIAMMFDGKRTECEFALDFGFSAKE